MFKKPFTLLLLLLSCFHVLGQTFQKTFGSIGDDRGQYALETLNGYLIAGSITPNGGSEPDAYLFEIDQHGNLLWQRSYGGVKKDVFMSVIPANDGGYIAIGETWSFGKGQQDLFVLKTDLVGNIGWCKTFGGAINDYARSIMPVSDGYILSGPEYSMGQGGLDAYFIRLDNQGNVKYSKTVGSSLDDQLQTLYMEGNILYAGGGVAGNGSFVTLDAQTCEVLSIKSYGGSGTEALYKCLPTPDSNFVLSDHTWSFTGGSEMRQWAMKVKRDGTPIWSKVYGFAGANFRGGIENTPDGGFILTPWDNFFPATSDGLLIKFDALGEVIWANRYGGNDSDQFYKTIPTSDGGYLTVGHTKSFGAGGEDIFVVKTDAAGMIGSCCPKPFTVNAQNFNLPANPSPLSVKNFATAQNWPLMVGDVAPFIFDPCTSSFPKGIRKIKLCSNETFEIDGKPYAAPVIVLDTLLNPFGCDSVIEYQLLPNPLVSATKTVAICPGDTATVNGIAYTQSGIFRDTIPATVGCDTALTITIFQNLDTLYSSEKYSICVGDTLSAHGAKLTVAGIYAFKDMSQVACVLIYNVQLDLEQPPAFDLFTLPAGCFRKPVGSIQIKNPQPGWQALLGNVGTWSGQSVFDKLPVGQYIVRVRSALGCEASQTVTIAEMPTFSLKIKLDTSFSECGRLSASVTSTSTFPIKYQWSPLVGLSCADCSTVQIQADAARTYTLLAVDSAGCRATGEVEAPSGEAYDIYAPNVFSPNGDGLNDHFTLYGSRCANQIRKLSIYDRSGSLLFYKENLALNEEAEGWDGYAGSRLSNPGVYTWWAEVEMHSGRRVMLEGAVTVVQ